MPVTLEGRGNKSFQKLLSGVIASNVEGSFGTQFLGPLVSHGGRAGCNWAYVKFDFEVNDVFANQAEQEKFREGIQHP